MKIGVFDSGLGGRIILDAIRARLPAYDYIYYGDTKNLPYGDKSEKEILAFTERGVQTLFGQGAILVIVACNTASVESLPKLQNKILIKKYQNRRILGVVIPTVEILIERKIKHAVLIGTSRTVESKKYEYELLKRKTAWSVDLHSVATPKLVPLIEAGAINDAYMYLNNILTHIVGETEAIVLGCTHYTVLKKELRKNNPNLQVISQDEIIPEKLVTYLSTHPEIEQRLTRAKSYEQIVTGDR